MHGEKTRFRADCRQIVVNKPIFGKVFKELDAERCHAEVQKTPWQGSEYLPILATRPCVKMVNRAMRADQGQPQGDRRLDLCN